MLSQSPEPREKLLMVVYTWIGFYSLLPVSVLKQTAADAIVHLATFVEICQMLLQTAPDALYHIRTANNIRYSHLRHHIDSRPS